MGGGNSTAYKSHAEREREAYDRHLRMVARDQKRAKKHAEQRRESEERERRKKAERAEKEAWLRSHDTGKGERRWWNAPWWSVYAWYKDRHAWEEEMRRRKGEGYQSLDDVVLKNHRD